VGSEVGTKDSADLVARWLGDPSNAVTSNDPIAVTINNRMRLPEPMNLLSKAAINLLLVERVSLI